MAKRVDDATLGICMQGYYGGRAEIRIRHTPMPVVYIDFTSQYPTVNTLMGLWRILTADKLRVQDATAEVRDLLKSLTLDRLFDPPMWPRLAFFALVQPNADVLPVRKIYAEAHANDQTNIGLNLLTSEKPLQALTL